MFGKFTSHTPAEYNSCEQLLDLFSLTPHTHIHSAVITKA